MIAVATLTSGAFLNELGLHNNQSMVGHHGSSQPDHVDLEDVENSRLLYGPHTKLYTGMVLQSLLKGFSIPFLWVMPVIPHTSMTPRVWLSIFETMVAHKAKVSDLLFRFPCKTRRVRSFVSFQSVASSSKYESCPALSFKY